MDVLSVIGVVFLTIILSWGGAYFFTKFGVGLGRRTHTHSHIHYIQPPTPRQPVQVDGFVRRVPGDEAGYIEDGQQ